MPSPARSRSDITCCAPVPDAATMPIRPGRTTLANPSAAPLTTAVPQSGPMTSTSWAAAASLSASSSASGTLSLNSMTDRPASTASRASRAAYRPGVLTSAIPAPLRRAAEPTVRAATSVVEPWARPRSCISCSTVVSISCPAATAAPSSPRSATTRSFGPASAGTSKPTSRMSARLSSVPMPMRASCTPGAVRTRWDTCIRVTESW